jgi:hypothetical protein
MSRRSSLFLRGTLLRSSPALLVMVALACGGEDSGPLPSDGQGSGGSAMGTGGGAPDEQPIAQAGRVRRLRKSEWTRSVRDLFFAESPFELSSPLPDDPKTEGYIFDGQAEQLNVDPTLWAAYQRSAQEVARQVTERPELIEGIAPYKAGQDASERAKEFLVSWLPRAFRRPISRAELEKYARLFETGSVSYPEVPPFEGGLRLVIEAALQSPHFLYRIEVSTEVEEDGLIPLDGFERATRLSYLLWGTTPDETLLAAADAGKLDDEEGVRAEAERMLDDPRAQESIQFFFERALDTERYLRISPSPTFYPDVSKDLPTIALEETRHFTFDIVFQAGGGVYDLLTSRRTFANASLAKIYGLSGDFAEDRFKLVELEPGERSGFLTQVGFLASHATSVNPDPIHRGVFVGKQLSCLDIQAPPANVPPLPDPEGKSNRELVAAHTEAPDTICRECHAELINPFGFPFESYDAVGAYRTMDGPHEVDTKAAPLIDGVPTPVSDAIEFAERLAGSRDVHRCMVGRIIEFAQGRKLLPEDKELASQIGEASLSEGLSFRELFVKIATSRAFLYRAPLASKESP